MSLREVNGKADVDVRAAGARVNVQDLNGEGRVALLAKQVTFMGTINGTVQAAVTLTAEGRLQFRELLGEARLLWKKERALDPAPKISRGRVNPAAVIREVK